MCKLTHTLSEITDRHAPSITRTRSVRPTLPCYDDNITSAKRKRRKAKRKWRKTGLQSDFNVFKTIKNQVTYLTNQARRSFYTDFVNNNSSDQGKLFRAAKKLLNKNEKLSFLENQNKTVLANDIGKFFVRKIVKIRDDIENCELDPEAC